MFHVKHRFRHRRRHGSTARSSIHHATSGDSCRGRPGPNAITRNRSSKRWTPSAGTRNHHDDQAISAGGSSILGVPTRNFFALTKGSGRRGCPKAWGLIRLTSQARQSAEPQVPQIDFEGAAAEIAEPDVYMASQTISAWQSPEADTDPLSTAEPAVRLPHA